MNGRQKKRTGMAGILLAMTVLCLCTGKAEAKKAELCTGKTGEAEAELCTGKTGEAEPELCTGKTGVAEPELCTGKAGAKAPKLSKTKLSMSMGEKKQLRVKNTKKKVIWKSSKPKVVKVSKKGVLTAKKAGKAVIRAKAGKKTLKCKVTVRKSVDRTGMPSSKCLEKGGIYYLRTDGRREGVKYPSGVLISSKKALQKYYKENCKYYQMAGDFKKTLNLFDKEFFKKKQLAMLRLEAESGSDSYRVIRVDYSRKYYQVEVEQIKPELRTSNMAQWHILIPIPEKIPTDSKIMIKVSKPKENRYVKVMNAAKLDNDGKSARSLAEYTGIETLTNKFTAQAVDTSGTPDLSGVRNFSYQIFGQTLTRMREENQVVAPISAYFALSMVAAGADGETRAQFAKVLGTTPEMLDKNVLCSQLKKHFLSKKNSTDLSIANSIWLNQSFKASDTYLQGIVDYFDSEVYRGPMDSAEMLNAANQWGNEKTHGLIPEIVKKGELTLDTMCHLMNAVYLKAAWEQPFSKESTQKMVFRTPHYSAKSIDFLYDKRYLDYVETDDAEGAVLPYDDGKTAFLVLRPTDGTAVREFAGRLDAESVKAYLANARNAYFHFYMPKADISNDVEMKDMLINMGLTDAFSKTKADLYKIAAPDMQTDPLYIERVFQKARIRIDEKGTEAAAITSIVIKGQSAPVREPDVARTLKLDSPYVYLVVDLPSQTPLFMGVMEDPDPDAPYEWVAE